MIILTILGGLFLLVILTPPMVVIGIPCMIWSSLINDWVKQLPDEYRDKLGIHAEKVIEYIKSAALGFYTYIWVRRACIISPLILGCTLLAMYITAQYKYDTRYWIGFIISCILVSFAYEYRRFSPEIRATTDDSREALIEIVEKIRDDVSFVEVLLANGTQMFGITDKPRWAWSFVFFVIVMVSGMIIAEAGPLTGNPRGPLRGDIDGLMFLFMSYWVALYMLSSMTDKDATC